MKIKIHYFLLLIIAGVLFGKAELWSQYKYSIYPDSVMMKIEKDNKSLESQVDAIEVYMCDLFHLVTLDYKDEIILPFFAKYERKVFDLKNTKSIGYFYLYKGAFFLDALQVDSASTYFIKALAAFESINDYTGIAHSSIFIAVNNNFSIDIRSKSKGLINYYYQKGFEASLKSDDFFAKASGAWNKSSQYFNTNKDSLIYYLNLSLSYVNKLPNDQLPKKLFAYKILGDMCHNYTPNPAFTEKIKKLLLETFRIVMQKKYFNTLNYKIDLVSYYKTLGNLKNAAFIAREILTGTVSSELWRNISMFKYTEYYRAIYDYEKEQGNFKEALEYYEKYHNTWVDVVNLDPRVSSIDNDRKILEELAQRERKVQNQREMLTLIIAGLLLFAVFLVSLYYFKRYKDRQRVNEELEKLNLTKDKLFSIVSHDLRNPVASLKQMLDIIMLRYDNLSNEAKQRYIGNLQDSNNKLFLMLDNLLSWSRLNLGKIHCTRANVDIDEIISSEIVLLEEAIERKNLRVAMKELEQGEAYIDENLVRIMVRNVLTNAVKFSPIDAMIEVSIHTDGKRYIFQVKDYGQGIEPEQIKNIYRRSIIEPKQGTAHERGNGLGLAIVSEFAEIHNGRLDIESVLGEHTIVSIVFE